MAKLPYDVIKNVESDEEPVEQRPYGESGVDYITDVQRRPDGKYVYTVLRFASAKQYALFRQING